MNELELKYYSHQKMQEKFREAMGNSRERDHFYCLACGANFTKRQDDCNCNDYESERWIILPLPIDPVNPERGLWGMCPGVVTIGKQLFIPGSYFVSVRITDENGNYKKFISFKGDTPTIVLLKALAHQWGVEVES